MSDKVTAIIVDDEQSARNILSNLLQRFCPNIEVLAQFTNVPDAVEGVKALNPQVVFLDIEMPEYAGFEIVRFFERVPFEIIFITAYDKYAIKAFEVAALDYLLKPIDIDRLKDAVARLEERLAVNVGNEEQIALLSETMESNSISKIAINEKGYRYMVAVDEIVAIEAQESYSRIHLQDGKSHIVSKNLKHYEDLFESHPDLFRSHKSWIINRKFLVNHSRTKLEINLEDGLVARLSKYRKAEFEKFLKQ